MCHRLRSAVGVSSSTSRRLGWTFPCGWMALVLSLSFAPRVRREPVDCCAPQWLAAATAAFMIGVFTLPIAVVGVSLINRTIGLNRVPRVAVAGVVAGVLGMPVLVALAVTLV